MKVIERYDLAFDKKEGVKMKNIIIKSIQSRIKETIGNENVIICGVSALECLNLFSGYFETDAVYVYALSQGRNTALKYNLVPSFENIETVMCNGLICTSVNQTFNDLLFNYEKIDDIALLEALSNYYHMHGQTFDELSLSGRNIAVFKSIEQSAIMYHCGG